jgi:hypothetical protein
MSNKRPYTKMRVALHGRAVGYEMPTKGLTQRICASAVLAWLGPIARFAFIQGGQFDHARFVESQASPRKIGFSATSDVCCRRSPMFALQAATYHARRMFWFKENRFCGS